MLCELHFADDRNSGQELLDDLRRNHLLPFATVFFMITGEATYVKVAEAAESALDGYLLKPHKATHLEERLTLARARKRNLQEIFDAIAAQDYVRAADLCLVRYLSKGPFWLYAARVGSDLLLRLGRHDEAQALYHAVSQDRALPWARLGYARALLESGRTLQACTALEDLLSESADQADAYDLLGRAQFELGQFDLALATFVQASTLTPSSISRAQRAGMMTFYSGDTKDAERLLERTTRLGLESKLFDPQVLVLLAFTRLELTDRRGLQRCRDDFARLMEREPENRRLQRLSQFADLCQTLQRQDVSAALRGIDQLAANAMDSEFDFESGCNLLTALTQVRIREIYCQPAEGLVQSLALRFCSSRPHTDLLAACARQYGPYAEWIRAAHAKVVAQTELALRQMQEGDAGLAISILLEQARNSLNVRLIDNAMQLLQKRLHDSTQYPNLMMQAVELRTLAGAGNRKLSLGRQARQAGGLTLRSGARDPKRAAAAPPTRPAPLTPQLRIRY